jgi:ligand-binding sensor protein
VFNNYEKRKIEMTPFDLKTRKEWEEILDRFSQEIHMTACISDDTGDQPICCSDRYPLCAAIRENRQATTSICSQSNTVMLAEVKQTLKPMIDICEAGLIRLVVPIVHQGNLIGQIFACGLSSKEEEIDSFLIAKELNISEEKVLELIKDSPFGSEEELFPVAERLFTELNS